MSKGLDISYKTDTLNNSLLIEVQKPNKGNEYFMYELMGKVTTGIANKFIDEFYPDIKDLIDTDLIHKSIAEEVTKLGLEKLKKGDKSNEKPHRHQSS